jgi:dolichyl-phosphate-mannose-protein mannosyltransferase
MPMNADLLDRPLDDLREAPHPDPVTNVTAAKAAFGREPASRAVVVLVLIVIALSAAVRLVNLDAFPTLVFDEYFYVHDANSLLHGHIGPRQPSPWKPGDDRSLAHPPLGVLSVAAGIVALGNNPWGWRVPSAIAGTLLIALVYPIARRLRLSPRWALVATVLAASDTLLIAESRIGVLDPFVALWSAVCIYCALRYVQSGRPARWLILTGATGGLAVASKWSGAQALLAAVAIVALAAWSLRNTGRGAGHGQTAATSAGAPAAAAGHGGGAAAGWRLSGRLARVAACLVVLSFAVYVASYAAYFASGHTIGQWLHLQGHMASYSWSFQAQGASDMASSPLGWILDLTPLWYRWTLEPGHKAVALIAIGDPFLFWGAIAAFFALSWLAWRRHDARLAVAPLLVAILYLPWLATTRQSYIYYLTPVVPFLAIMVAAALARLAGGRPLRARWAGVFFGVGAVLTTVAAGGSLIMRLAALAALAFAAGAVVMVARRHGDQSRCAVWKEVVPWLYSGAVAGMSVAWLPFVVGLGIPVSYYERLVWLATWR